MKTKGRKAKGSKYERDLAKMFKDYGIDKRASRMPLSGAAENLKGDLYIRHDEAIPFKFVHEAKRQETIKIPEWWKQAVEQAGFGTEPVLHFKRSHRESLTVIRTTTFLSLLKTILDLTYEKE